MHPVLSHRASYRDEASEDHLLVLPVGERACVLAVADGVGGQPGGGEAAQRVIAAVAEVGASLVRRRSQAWMRLLRALDQALLAEPEAGLTTLVALCLTPGRIVGASVGDSEAWWITAEGHYDLTEAQQRKPYLGSGSAVPIPFELTLTQPGTLLVASDGLFKYADPLSITDLVRTDPARAPEALEALVRSPRGRLYDDLALLLATADKIPPWNPFLSRFRAG